MATLPNIQSEPAACTATSIVASSAQPCVCFGHNNAVYASLLSQVLCLFVAVLGFALNAWVSVVQAGFLSHVLCAAINKHTVYVAVDLRSHL